MRTETQVSTGMYAQVNTDIQVSILYVRLVSNEIREYITTRLDNHRTVSKRVTVQFKGKHKRTTVQFKGTNTEKRLQTRKGTDTKNGQSQKRTR